MAFPSTHWSLIKAAGAGSGAERRQALDTLARLYRRPVLQRLLAKGYSHHDAEDLVQAFFADWLAKNLFSRADPVRGSFRSFFLTVLDNFLKKAHRHAHAQLRSPAHGFSDIEPDRVAADNPPDEVFWRAFASDLTRETLADVEASFERRGMSAHVRVFRAWWTGPVLDGAQRPSRAALARAEGVTEKQISNMITTFKRAYQIRLLRHVTSYAADEADARSELSALMGYLDMKPGP